MLRNMRLQRRLVFGVIGSVLVVLTLITAVSFVSVRNALEGEVKARVLNLVQAQVNEMDGFFQAVGRIPVVLASASAMDRENNEALLRARIAEVLLKNPDTYGSTVAFEPYYFYPDQKYFSPYYYREDDGLGYVQLGTDDYVYFRDWEWYTGPRDTKRLYWTLPYFDEGAGNIWMVTASYPVIRDGEFIGVATIDVPIEDVQQSLSKLQVGSRGYALMFDHSGGIVAVGRLEGLKEGDSVLDWASEINDPQLDTLINKMLEGGEGIMEMPDPLTKEGLTWVVYAPVPSTGWSVASFVSADEMLARVVPVLLLLVGISVLGMAISAAVISAISSSITRPMETLRSEALAIAQGDLTRRVPIQSRDEIGVTGQAFNRMADEVEQLLEGLEQRVADRTRGLQAAAEVSRAITSVLDPNELLRQVVDLARERFDLYYVGLFLLDEERRFAVLRAGTGEAGQKMLAQGHRLEVGGKSMIGQCVARAEARIALDVGEEPVRFDNPLLPETRSELALPLRSRGRVIGAMTVQSAKEAAFDETGIAVFQTMADQVAVAIDNAWLFTNAQAALAEMEAIHRRYLGQAWAEYALTRAISGYEQTDAGIMPLDDKVLPEVQQTVTGQRPIVWRGNGDEDMTQESSPSALVVPILLRGQPIGALGFKEARGKRRWSAEDVALAGAIAEQLALAADNLRLLDETQRRAARERLTSKVTARMRETLDLEAVLKTAAGEMRQTLGLDKIVIRLATDEADGDSA
jgi:GAF domain-containing protein/HAMP domain-containing protein